MSSDARPPVDYKTHMLIGVRPNGIMTVLADWPYVPRQAEVQEQIDVTPESYDAFVLATPWAFAANEITDRADVDKLIFALKDALGRRDQKAVSKLLASDTNRPELSRALLNLNPGTSESADKPWSESSRPILMINTVRFPERNLAEVDTAATRYGSVANRNATILFLLKREKAGWRIESMRAGPPPR